MKNLPEVEPIMSWRDLFGSKGNDIKPDVRRKRWELWKHIVTSKGDQHVVDYWAKDNLEEACGACIHRDNDWCKSYGLPCNVNPILTIQSGIIGMACMGLGKEVKPVQLNLFYDDIQE